MKGFSECSINTNVPVKVTIDGKSYGSAPIQGIFLFSGFHDLRMVNEEYLIDETQQIFIDPGIPFERDFTLGHFGTINLNAMPWADVYVDEKFVGQTPIANLRLTVGNHEIKFLNPKFPIKRRNVTILEGANSNISVNMSFR